MKNVLGMEIKSQIGAVIRSHRLLRNMLQRDLARKVGVSRVFINLIENGKSFPSVSLFKKIAKALGSDTDKLIAEIPSKELLNTVNMILKEGDPDKIGELTRFTASLAKQGD